MSFSTVVERERPFVVELDAFSGPLDLLLHLVREQEIDITDIPIARIADQFLEAVATLGLDEAANYLEMAAWLLRIKIQVLLPRPFDDENWEDPRAELVRRLLEYEQVREVARWLEGQADLRSGQFPRGWLPEPPEQEPSPIVLDLDQVLAAVCSKPTTNWISQRSSGLSRRWPTCSRYWWHCWNWPVLAVSG